MVLYGRCRVNGRLDFRSCKGIQYFCRLAQKIYATPPPILVFLADMLVFVVAGAYFGTGIYTPTTFVAAIAAGLTWPLGLGALATTDKPDRKTATGDRAAANASDDTKPNALAGSGS